MERDDEEQLETFLKWAADVGISDSPNLLQPSHSCLGRSLSISHFPDAGGRGLAAFRDLRKGEVILRVPKAALLTRENALKDKRLAISVEKHSYLSSTQVLTVCLLTEVGKGRGSWWHPYLIQLPRTYNTLANFTRFEIQALQVDDAIWASEKAISKAQSEWKEALILMQEIGLKQQLLTFRSWLWASATVLLCYGTYTNLELLEHYGFLLNPNPNDRAFIQLDTDIHSSNSWPCDTLYIEEDGKPSFALLSALRLWATPTSLRRAVGHLAYSGSLLSTANEISVMKWMLKKCQDLLGTMPTTTEDDSLLLHDIEKMQSCGAHEVGVEMLACEGELIAFFDANGMSKGDVAEFPLTGKARRSMERWNLAVQWRFRYKKNLLDCISYCSEMINHLSQEQLSSRTY